MASQNKFKKLKNSYMVKSGIKNKNSKCKRLQFYTASQRKENKKIENLS